MGFQRNFKQSFKEIANPKKCEIWNTQGAKGA